MRAMFDSLLHSVTPSPTLFGVPLRAVLYEETINFTRFCSNPTNNSIYQIYGVHTLTLILVKSTEDVTHEFVTEGIIKEKDYCLFINLVELSKNYPSLFSIVQIIV